MTSSRHAVQLKNTPLRSRTTAANTAVAPGSERNRKPGVRALQVMVESTVRPSSTNWFVGSRTEYALPLELEVGDKVEILSTGAYTASYASVGFNGFPPLRTYCI